MSATYRFGRFEVDVTGRRLLVDGRAAAVGQRAFDLLVALIERRDRLVTKAELFELAWPNLVVEENNLQVQVSALRKLVGTQAIETVPGRGYRFRAGLDTAAPAIAAPATAAAPAAGLFGRDADLAALLGLLDTHRLVTVVGAGGIGKSSLALAAAGAAGGRWPETHVVELAGLADATLLPDAVAQALAVKAAGKSVTAEDLAVALAPSHALVLLDNCEHLLEAVGALVVAILHAAPDLTILATSQEPLHLPPEQQYRLLPLAVPTGTEPDARAFGAVALFEARVRATDPRFVLTGDNLPLAVDICRQLDGLPLAIELAAARSATLGLRAVRDKLDARFKLLTGGARHTLRRHQTLRAALEWSHNLLDDDERTVFRRLGAFAGGFTVELAQAVAGDGKLDEWRVLDLLSQLVDKSLVSVDPGDPPRYRLLESARAFALEQLGENESADALRRHAHAMRDFIVAVDTRNMDGELRTDQYAALVVPELDNLRAAHAWARAENEAETATAIAAHSGSLIDHAAECMDWLLSVPEEAVASVAVELQARYYRALAAGNMFNFVPSARRTQAAQRAVELYRGLGEPKRLFSALMRLVLQLYYEDDHAAAATALDEARALLSPDWPPEFRINWLRRQSGIVRAQGRLQEARALIEESNRLSATAGDWRLEVMGHTVLIDLLWLDGPTSEALAAVKALTDALRARPAAPNDMDVHYANLLGILSESGDLAGARDAAREALQLLVRTRVRYFEPWVYFLWRAGQLDDAARVLGAASTQLASAVRGENEERLLRGAREGLAAALPAERLAALEKEGAALSLHALYVLLGAANRDI